MKVAVFGGSGFIGSHVADELTARGHEVRVVDLNESPYLKEGQEMVATNILEPEEVTEAVKGCDFVYNFAGIADLDSASTKPADTVQLNVLGNINILNSCLEEKIKRFVYASTIYVYSSLGGFYRCSKQSSELYIEEFSKKYGLNYTILRYGTVYGPRSDERNSIYRQIKQALSEGKIVCDSTGDEMREYIHVRDVAKLSVDVLSDEFNNERVIITGHHPTKFKDMLGMINEMLENKIQIELKGPQGRNNHYGLTPYSFTLKIGKKLVSNHYVDLGQGLLECMTEIQEKLNKEKGEKND